MKMKYLRIIVRGRSDASAVEKSLKLFYPEWEVDVDTLKGARRIEDVIAQFDRLLGEENLRRYFYTILLLGREDRELSLEISRRYVDNFFIVHTLPRSKVRNMRLEHIMWELERARSIIRNCVGWHNGSYIFTPKHGLIDDLLTEPYSDSFIMYGKGVDVLSKIAGYRFKGTLLLIRGLGGLHKVYAGDKLVGYIEIPDKGSKPSFKTVDKNQQYIEGPSLRDVIWKNREIIERLESKTIMFMKSIFPNPSTVIVPWSGGKDSTVALILALKAYGKRRVVAVYCDTGAEFPHTQNYVEDVAKKLGVSIVTTYAGIDREILRRRQLPTHSNRWCTIMKVNSIEKTIGELVSDPETTILVLGDRDSESEPRSRRPVVRVNTRINVTEIAPLKMWGTAHVQTYLLKNNIGLNPLYDLGFYRIGCYICPSLRSWEKFVMRETGIYNELRGKVVLGEFLDIMMQD